MSSLTLQEKGALKINKRAQTTSMLQWNYFTYMRKTGFTWSVTQSREKGFLIQRIKPQWTSHRSPSMSSLALQEKGAPKINKSPCINPPCPSVSNHLHVPVCRHGRNVTNINILLARKSIHLKGVYFSRSENFHHANSRSVQHVSQPDTRSTKVLAKNELISNSS